MKKIIVYSSILFCIGCSCGEEKKQPEPTPQAPLSQSENSEKFNNKFSLVMNGYYQIHLALYNENIDEADKQAEKLMNEMDSLSLTELKADTGIISTAQDLANNIRSDISNFKNEKDINGKRNAFNTLSNNLISFIRTIKFDGDKIYQFHSEQALDNLGADWLSNKQVVVNPYGPKETTQNGFIIDTICFKK